MPIYEFKCDSCGEVFEQFCRDYTTEEVMCPECEYPAYKIPSLSSFKLEGNHWAKDGYGIKDKK